MLHLVGNISNGYLRCTDPLNLHTSIGMGRLRLRIFSDFYLRSFSKNDNNDAHDVTTLCVRVRV